MDNYFLLYGKNYAPGANAFASNQVSPHYIFAEKLKDAHQLPFDFNLVKLTIAASGVSESSDLEGLNNIWLDYQPNNLALPMFSERMQEIIDQNLTGNEEIDWISAKIKGNNEERNYYILRFNKALDVLDYDKTSFIEDTDHVIEPTFELTKIRSYSIFHIPSPDHLCTITRSIYINERLKNQLQKERLTGLNFEKVSSHRIA